MISCWKNPRILSMFNTLLCKILMFSHSRFKILLCGSLAQCFSSHFTQGVSIVYTKGEWYVSFRRYIAQWDFWPLFFSKCSKSCNELFYEYSLRFRFGGKNAKMYLQFTKHIQILHPSQENLLKRGIVNWLGAAGSVG